MVVPQLLKVIQMMTEKLVGKVVHLPMVLVALTLLLVIILVFVHLNLVEKLVVMKIKVVDYVSHLVRLLVN